MNDKNFSSYVIIFIVIAVAVGFVAYYFGVKQGLKKGEDLGRKAIIQEQEELSKKVKGQAEVKPVENLPEPNPFKANTNPFKDLYQNPFK